MCGVRNSSHTPRARLLRARGARHKFTLLLELELDFHFLILHPPAVICENMRARAVSPFALRFPSRNNTQPRYGILDSRLVLTEFPMSEW